MPTKLRTLIYRAAGMNVALGTQISPGCIFRDAQLNVARGSTINYRCIFDNRAPVTIGEFVGVGINVSFITSGHDPADPRVRAGVGRLEPITVGDGAWIGSGVTVLGGSSIGAGCVIAAGAVVRGECEPHSLYGGVPARKIRDLPQNSR